MPKAYEASAISDRKPVGDIELVPYEDRPMWPFVIWDNDVRTKAVAAGADRDAVNEILGFRVKNGSTRATHWWLSHETPESAVEMLVEWARDLAAVSAHYTATSRLLLVPGIVAALDEVAERYDSIAGQAGDPKLYRAACGLLEKARACT